MMAVDDTPLGLCVRSFAQTEDSLQEASVSAAAAKRESLGRKRTFSRERDWDAPPASVLVDNFMARLEDSRENQGDADEIITDGLDHVLIGLRDVKNISRAIADHPSLKGLYLSYCGMSRSAVEYLSKALQQNTQLTSIDFSGNNFTDKAVNGLCSGLSQHKSITSINLSANSFTHKGAQVLANMLNKKNQEGGGTVSLALDENNIDSRGLKSICNSLKENDCLEELSLKNNLINDTGASILAGMLKTNTTLKKLALNENYSVTKNGLSELASAMRKNHSLTELKIEDNSTTGEAIITAIEKSLERNREESNASSPASDCNESPFLTDITEPALPPLPDDVLQWDIKDVCNWLKLKNMTEYLPAFANNKIDGLMLVTLNESHLEEDFNMTNTWHRQRMLHLLDDLRNNGVDNSGGGGGGGPGSPSNPRAFGGSPSSRLQDLSPTSRQRTKSDSEAHQNGKPSRPASASCRMIFEEQLTDWEFLDEGQFGKTFLANYKGQRVVVKKSHDRVITPDVLRELRAFIGVPSHPRVLPLLGIGLNANPNNISFVTEYMRGGSLKHALNQNPAWFRVLNNFLTLAIDIAQGLGHLHKHKFVHRDVASRNILLDQNYRACVTDFGLARILSYSRNEESREVGAYYRMPMKEYMLPVRWLPSKTLLEGFFSESTDVYMLGMTLWEVLSGGKKPFGDLTTKQVVDGKLNGELDIRPMIPDLVVECFESLSAGGGGVSSSKGLPMLPDNSNHNNNGCGPDEFTSSGKRRQARFGRRSGYGSPTASGTGGNNEAFLKTGSSAGGEDLDFGEREGGTNLPEMAVTPVRNSGSMAGSPSRNSSGSMAGSPSGMRTRPLARKRQGPNSPHGSLSLPPVVATNSGDNSPERGLERGPGPGSPGGRRPGSRMDSARKESRDDDSRPPSGSIQDFLRASLFDPESSALLPSPTAAPSSPSGSGSFDYDATYYDNVDERKSPGGLPALNTTNSSMSSTSSSSSFSSTSGSGTARSSRVLPMYQEVVEVLQACLDPGEETRIKIASFIEKMKHARENVHR